MSQPITSPRPVREAVRPTTIIESPRLSRRLGANVTLASETFQHTGSFKFRAACNVAARVPERLIIAASSGNFGQAMACACQLLGKSCLIVMPHTSARVKIEAVKEYGGQVDLIDVAVTSRKARVAELTREHPDAYVASAYDDPLVIEGNATLGAELARFAHNAGSRRREEADGTDVSGSPPPQVGGYGSSQVHSRPDVSGSDSPGQTFDFIIAPVGGGGLASGIVTGLRASGSTARVLGAEPLRANDAARSFRAGHIVSNESEPDTIADGARTVSLGQHNWAVLQTGLAGMVEVSEENIKEGMRLLFSLANLKAEPTGALSVGALLAEPDRFRGRSVCCVVSGGNVDPDLFGEILRSAPAA